MTAPRDVLMLLHSIGTDSSIWNETREYLPAEYMVIAPNSRGHGGDERSGASLENWIGDLDELIDAIGDANVHLAGLSMGGIQAMAYAARYGDKLASVILADTFATLTPEAAATRLTSIGDRVWEAGMPEHAKKYVDETLIAQQTPERIEQLIDSIARIPADLYLESANATFTVDLRNELQKIKVPTLVIHGERDEKTPRALSEEIASLISDAELVTVPGAGHLSALDAPQAFAEAVTQFIGSVQVPSMERQGIA